MTGRPADGVTPPFEQFRGAPRESLWFWKAYPGKQVVA